MEKYTWYQEPNSSVPASHDIISTILTTDILEMSFIKKDFDKGNPAIISLEFSSIDNEK